MIRVEHTRSAPGEQAPTPADGLDATHTSLALVLKLESLRANARIAETIVEDLAHSRWVDRQLRFRCAEQQQRQAAADRLISLFDSHVADMSSRTRDAYLRAIVRLLEAPEASAGWPTGPQWPTRNKGV